MYTLFYYTTKRLNLQDVFSYYRSDFCNILYSKAPSILSVEQHSFHEIANLWMVDYHEIAQGAILYVKDEKSVQKLTFRGGLV